METKELLFKIDQIPATHLTSRKENAIKLINQFKKEILTDFFKWINNFEELEYTKKGIKFYVDEFLTK